MMTTVENAISIAPVGGQGQVLLPDDFLREHSLAQDSLLVMIRVGEALVIAPYDRAFAEATAPIQRAWESSGLTEADLPEILRQIRLEVAREKFGDLITD